MDRHQNASEIYAAAADLLPFYTARWRRGNHSNECIWKCTFRGCFRACNFCLWFRTKSNLEAEWEIIIKLLLSTSILIWKMLFNTKWKLALFTFSWTSRNSKFNALDRRHKNQDLHLKKCLRCNYNCHDMLCWSDEIVFFVGTWNRSMGSLIKHFSTPDDKNAMKNNKKAWKWWQFQPFLNWILRVVNK